MSTTVVESPLPTAERSRPLGGTARAFRRRTQIIDRIARSLISVSGIGIICAVLGIGVFLIAEILPLFSGATLHPGLVQSALPPGEPPQLVLVDEHQEKALVIGTSALVRTVSLDGAEPPQVFSLDGLQGHRITAASRTLREETVALGTDQGRVWIGTVALRTLFDGSQRRVQPSVSTDSVFDATPGYRITRLAYRATGTHRVIAAVADDRHLIVTRIRVQRPLVGPARQVVESVRVPTGELGTPSALLVSEDGLQILLGTAKGILARWRLPEEGAPQLLEASPAVSGGSLTAMDYLLGARSVVVGGSDGGVATWSLVRDEERPDGWRLARIHTFAAHPERVTVIAPSPRDKGFITASLDGTARLHYMTSERTLAHFMAGRHPVAADMAPKTNGAVVLSEDGLLRHWHIENPHPDISWRGLFGKTWYEGYAGPEYIWQSTGGTDDFESKYSLIPLIFGTLKGTVYALLFAVPLALFGALYCSQFLDKRWRNPIKSTVELMAALPSVVLGFIAGVVIAPLVQSHVVAVLAMPAIVPLVTLGGILASHALPWAQAKTFARRNEFWVLTAWVVVGIVVAGGLGPLIERIGFQGDFESWLTGAAGLLYDQRNSLVVGWAMGFAVIPVIFTVCEDAFSSVPRHLVGASLACGASSWQTAWRVVLPAAGSGVFSAIMIGFGRAVGETMIVLMATGNTPVMDWSLFNGFRALSANIAVEIPEAPHGGTLYRVLFVAALLLYAMTSVVNTAAELIRLRLRRQLQGL